LAQKLKLFELSTADLQITSTMAEEDANMQDGPRDEYEEIREQVSLIKILLKNRYRIRTMHSNGTLNIAYYFLM
jgi:hypothetical protein